MTAAGRTGRLSGKVALVTGAGSRGEGIGIGRATAILLAREGARVGLLDRNREWADLTHRMIMDEGGEAAVIEAEVTDPGSCQDAVRAVTSRWHGLDILVNVVGTVGPPGTAVDVDLDAWDRGMRVNVTSMVLTSRAAIPAMRERGGGAIVNISSIGGLLGGDPALLYPTSKGAVVQLTRAMAALHGREGIRVNCVAPGVVYTPFVVEAGGLDEEMREIRRESTLLGIEGTGWDVGYAVRYLASDEARWVTGVILPVDGGFTSGRRTQLVVGFHDDQPAGT
ncbi:SDR family NAD(P)-dependent oxidoreductase [Amycolatopsis viridis]|uniref:NAD(P)-dependent dehydrogenase (Short-subunit alcohol dehydrogenase family) n=1 Tax=Amycolatopsis viridis TaxID=185678 RepID=A0ABX0SQD1_9PSEU|nr:SDR family oxidoreductase [Amycolatopsis viridis]NIH79103.1 NAD(P)-dependent dehydrogenase (short-subunit alcohol dehydrogenase family) [Amycolatopsis viridis]